jgi:eukaryotic-like serine/threonine-protein kinase
MPVTGLSQIPAATSVVHTGDTDPDGTQVMDAPTGTEVLGAAGVGAAAGAYAAYPPSGYDPGYEDGVPAYEPYPPRPQEPEKKRGIGLWWIPIIVLLAAIGFFAWAYASNNGGGAATVTTTTVTAPASTSTSTSSTPTTITPSRTTSTTTTQSTTSSPPQVVINKNDFVGKSFDEAKGILEGAGWKDDQIKQDTKPGKEPAGTVTDIKPTGKVNVGTPITLTVSDGNATAAPKTKGGDGSGD